MHIEPTDNSFDPVIWAIGRMNFLHPPFNNLKMRRAALLALRQKDVLDALTGNPKYYRLCGAVFGCDTPLATDVGSEALVKGNRMAEQESCWRNLAMMARLSRSWRRETLYQ